MNAKTKKPKIVNDFAKKVTSTLEPITETIQAPTNPLSIMVESLRPVDLIKTLTDGIGDPLSKYAVPDDNGQWIINETKVPDNLYIVAIIYEVIHALKKLNLGACILHGAIYIYNGKYWEVVGDEEVKRILSDVSVRLGYYQPANARVSGFRDKLFKQFNWDAVTEAVIPTNDRILINLNNGTLEVKADKVTLSPHDRNDFMTYVLDYDYDDTATSPIFDTFLNKVIPDAQTHKGLQEFTGHIFSQGLKMEKCAVLYGSGANGKSVFFEIISAMVGTKNMSSKGLGMLCQLGDRGDNHRSETENKLVNYSSEINATGSDIDMFKTYTSEEPVSARRLYKDVYTFRPTAKLIFNANKLPTVTEKTDAYFRRFLIFPFNITIEEEDQDRSLHTKIIRKEMSGVLNWAIAGLVRLIEKKTSAKYDGRVTFTTSPEMGDAIENFKRESNSVLLFAEEYGIKADEDKFTSSKDLYEAYSSFCMESGYNRFNGKNFAIELAHNGFRAGRKENIRGFKVDFYATTTEKPATTISEKWGKNKGS